MKCGWCGKDNRRASEWEQQRLRDDTWQRLCVRCANWRLRNPYNALLPMRRYVQPVETATRAAGDPQ